MIPWLIGAAVVGVGAALLGGSDDKKPKSKAQPKYNHTETKKLPSITLNGQSITIHADNS